MSLDDYEFQFAPTEAHLTALGKVLVESGVLEDVLELAIWQMMGVPESIGEQITTRPNLGQRVAMLLALVPVRFPSSQDQSEFAIIGQELKSIIGIRNHLAHAHWGSGVKQDEPITLNRRNEKGEIVPRQRTWRSNEIERIAARISRVGDELILFLEFRGVSCPPLPSKPWKQYRLPLEPKWKDRG